MWLQRPVVTTPSALGWRYRGRKPLAFGRDLAGLVDASSALSCLRVSEGSGFRTVAASRHWWLPSEMRRSKRHLHHACNRRRVGDHVPGGGIGHAFRMDAIVDDRLFLRGHIR